MKYFLQRQWMDIDLCAISNSHSRVHTRILKLESFCGEAVAPLWFLRLMEVHISDLVKTASGLRHLLQTSSRSLSIFLDHCPLPWSSHSASFQLASGSPGFGLSSSSPTFCRGPLLNTMVSWFQIFIQQISFELLPHSMLGPRK